MDKKKYTKPCFDDELIELEDIIAKSGVVGDDTTDDSGVSFGNIW